MFSIYLLDNPQLYQWDLNRKIKIIGKEENIDEIHICHIGDEEALVVPIKKEKNILIADIPNILLQTSEEIMVYLVKNNKTIKEFFFKVNNRERPSAYVYEETEVLNYSLLNKRLNQLEEDLDNIVVDNIELPKPDWADSDVNSINYIANRTHYEKESPYFTFNDYQEEPIGIFCASDLSEWTLVSSLKIYIGYEQMLDPDYDYRFEIIHTSRLIKNGKLYENYSTSVLNTNTFLIDSDNYYITGNKINFNIYVILNPSILTDEYKNKFNKRGIYIETYPLDGKYTMELLKMKIRLKFFKALDRRFIPAKIARVEKVDALAEEVNVLKEKINLTNDDILSLLVESNIIHPLTDNDNSIFTDKDGKIFVL